MFEKIKQNRIFFYFLPILFLAMILIGHFSLLGFLGIVGLVILSIIFIFILKEPFWGLLFLVFTLPFERIPTLDVGFVTLKMDQVFAGLTLISWILKILFERRKLAPYPIFWPVLFFIGISAISALYAVDKNRSIMVLVFVVFMILVSLLVTNLVASKAKLETLLKILLLSTLVVSLFGIYQFLGDIVGLPIALTGLKDIYTKAVLGFPRVHAFSMEPLYFANLLFIPLGLLAGMFFFKETKLIPLWQQFLLLLLVVVLIILGISRGAYIALVVFVLIFAIFLLKRVLTWKNIILILVSVIVMGGVTFTFLSASRPDAVTKFLEHAQLADFSQGESVQKRLIDYQKAIDYWQEKPYLGIGPGNYGPRYLDYPSHDQVTDWEIVNNQYLETLAETGVLGLFFLVIIYLAVIIRSIQAYLKTNDSFLKSILFGLLAAFIAILVQYNFFSTLYIMHIWFLIGLLIAIQNLALAKGKQ